MPIPEDFNAQVHTMNVIRQIHNRDVKLEFHDIEDDDNILIPRGSLKRACLIEEGDPINLVLSKQFLFYFGVRKCQDLFPPIYGIPQEDFDANKKYKPSCKLYFKEDAIDVEHGYQPVQGILSFTIKNSGILTETELKTLARTIKHEFVSNSPYQWRRGKNMLSYADKDNNFFTHILCRNKQDGINLVKKVLTCAELTYHDKCVTYAENEEPSQAYPTVPNLVQTPKGQKKAPRKRPIATVNFAYAVAHGVGWGYPIVLVDCTHRYRNAYEFYPH